MKISKGDIPGESGSTVDASNVIIGTVVGDDGSTVEVVIGSSEGSKVD